MNVKFTKMQGLGNDFVVINKIDQDLPNDLSKFSKQISDRHFGIGCDQVLFIDKSGKADFKMLIFNADGGEVEMCGNGIRCLAKYVYDNDLTQKKKLEVETMAGIIKPQMVGNKVKVDMGKPKFNTEQWIYNDEKTMNRDFEIDDNKFKITLVSMGNPHCIIFVNEITDHLVLNIGPKIETHRDFPNDINVEFAKVLDKNNIAMRVWERGAGETLACGTGASACLVASVINNKTEPKATLHLKGGGLEIEWAKNNHVYMTGPAKKVFQGDLIW